MNAIAPLKPSAARSQDAKVFIVEDDHAVSDSLSQLLGMQGYRTSSFPSAEAFLAALSPDSSGCAILDIRLPGVSGLELQATLTERHIDLPVIIITGYSTESSAIEAVNLGVAGYLTKPFRVPQVLAAAAKALGE